MIDNLKKYWFLIAFLIGLVGTMGTYVYNQGVRDKDVQTKIFETVDQKIKVVNKVKALPTIQQMENRRMLDSFNTVSAIKSRAMRDSVYLEEVKARKITDSIVLLNAHQMFQIKEQLKRIKQ